MSRAAWENQGFPCDWGFSEQITRTYVKGCLNGKHAWKDPLWCIFQDAAALFQGYKTQSHLLILTLLFPPTPSEERQLCHSFYLSSEVDNFRVALLPLCLQRYTDFHSVR